MDTEHYRRKLLDKQQELLDSLAQSTSDVSELNDVDVEDEIDSVERSEAKTELYDRNSRELLLLTQVRDALARMDAGNYGTCKECGNEIEEKRLEAIPWAAFDLEHQKQRDEAASKSSDGLTAL